MITVAIPAYNEQNTIKGCILSILEQISTSDEIIVLLDGCTDRTSDIVKTIENKHVQVRLIQTERRGKASSLNIIHKLAKGKIIVQTDGDVWVEQNAIKELIKHFNDPKIGAVSARVIPIISKDNMFHKYTLTSYQQLHERRIKESKVGTLWIMNGELCAYRKETMDVIPSDIKGSVDALMGLLVRRKGYEIVYEPNARAYIRSPRTIRDFVRQKTRIIAGLYQLKLTYDIEPSTFTFFQKKSIARSMRKEGAFFPPFLPHSFLPSFLASFIVSKGFFFIALLYVYSWLYAWWLIRTRKTLSAVWKRVDSTK